MFPITKWNRYKPRFPLVVGGGEAEPSRFQAAVRLPSYPQGSQLISCAKILARHGGEDTRIGRNGHSILCTLFYTRNVPNKFADYFSFFFFYFYWIYFLEQFQVYTKTSRSCRDFPYTSWPHKCVISCIINIPQQSGTFVTVMNPHWNVRITQST